MILGCASLKVDAQQGAFSMYAELAAADGRFEGYIKPILEDPEIFDTKEATSGPFQKAWEAIVGFAAKILEHQRRAGGDPDPVLR